MQYFVPPAPHFVGDCMPFYHDGVFHLYWLQDENHHQGKGGLGGHQWAHSSSQDLVHWTHHPLAIAIDADWEGSICTGSVFHHAGSYYAYYATRLPDRSEHLSLAISSDSIHFEKAQPNPFASPIPPYKPGHYRDPFVFRSDDGSFHMLVTAELAEPPLDGRGGCLAHLVSSDLRQWQALDPFIVPGYTGQPECPDYFLWNGWYYLMFSPHGLAHYRMSRQPFGPWLCPPVDVLDGPQARVMKTAAFGESRRLGVAFLESSPPHPYAGNAVFREIIQHADGTLGARFPAEMVPAAGPALAALPAPLTGGVTCKGRDVRIDAGSQLAAAVIEGVPQDVRITVTVSPEQGAGDMGLCLRGTGRYATGVELRCQPARQKVGWRLPSTQSWREVENAAVYGVSGLDCPFTLDIIAKDDIFDVCIDGRRTLIARQPGLSGDRLFLFCQNGSVLFSGVTIRPLA